MNRFESHSMSRPEVEPDTHHDASSNVFFGFWLYLMTDCILFATLFAAYIVLQSGTAGGPTAADLFSLPYALQETLILLSSSFTCGIAMLAAQRNRKALLLFWLAVTFLLGALFMNMELSEFSRLIAQGYTWRRSAFLSSYFTLIGTHGLHVVLGLMMMVVFALQMHFRGLTEVVLRRLICLKMFWHFLYLIWIFEFILVYLLGVK